MGSMVTVFGAAPHLQTHGHKDNRARCHTQPVMAIGDNGVDKNVNVVQVKCGQQCFAAVTDEGALLTWGLAEGGRLGHGSDHDLYFPVPKPTRVMFFRGEKVASVSCGAHHMMAVLR